MHNPECSVRAQRIRLGAERKIFGTEGTVASLHTSQLQ
jgi:hypothetical protein